MNKLRSYFRADEGATAVEYGIMVALIAAVIIVTVAILGGQVEEGFSDVSEELSKQGFDGDGGGAGGDED